MELLPINTPVIRPGDDVASVLRKSAALRAGDIVIVSSKAVATAENAAILLSRLSITPEARAYAAKTGRSEGFMEAVLAETKRLQGRVVGTAPGALLTELFPAGMHGQLLVPNAGLDESNIGKDFCIGWPKDPVGSAATLREKLMGMPVVITDSCCVPRRRGVTAFALSCAGIDPFRPLQGEEDLFGKKMRITVEAVADQLAIAGNMVMGNAAEAIPAVIARGHGLPSSDFCGWVDAMDEREDLFREIMKANSFER